MTLVQHLLRLTSFRNPLLQTLVPSVAASFAIQTAFAVPSVLAQSDRFYDFSGALTFLTVTAISLYLPSIRARQHAAIVQGPLQHLMAPPTPSPVAQTLMGVGGKTSGGGYHDGFNWRQLVLSGMVAIWAIRLGSYLFKRILQEGGDSRFDEIKKSKPRFWIAFMAQATWVSCCLMPVIAINSIPSTAFASSVAAVSSAVKGAAGQQSAGPLAKLRLTDIVGLSLWVGGFMFEVIADRQKAKWAKERREKLHNEEFLTRGLWSKSRYPNYFGESVLWTGIATTAAGVLLSNPVRTSAYGMGPFKALALCYISPAFVTFLLLKVSGVPLSEKKYDAKYGERKEYQKWKKETPKFFPKIF